MINQILGFISQLSLISAAIGAVVGFVATFFMRLYFFNKKNQLDAINTSVTELEKCLSQIFEEALIFIEKYLTIDDLDVKKQYTELKRQLMIARINQLQKITETFVRLDKDKFPLNQQNWINIRQASDRIFDKPDEVTTIAQLANIISNFSSCYKKVS